MIIPKYRNPTFKEGNIIISLKLIDFDDMIISPYHEFTITKIEKKKGEYDTYYLIDNDGVVITHKCYNGNLENDFSLKVDLECAKKRNKKLNDDKKFYKFIRENCPNMFEDFDYEDRDNYNACKISNPKQCTNHCQMKFKCINHIDDKIIQKNKFILVYLRDKKLNKINKINNI